MALHRGMQALRERFTACLKTVFWKTNTQPMKTDISSPRNMSAGITRFRRFLPQRDICLMKLCTRLVQKLRIILLSITPFPWQWPRILSRAIFQSSSIPMTEQRRSKLPKSVRNLRFISSHQALMKPQKTAKKTTSYAMKTAMHRLKCSLTESMSFIKLRVWKIPNRWRTLKSISAKTKKNISICSMTQ